MAHQRVAFGLLVLDQFGAVKSGAASICSRRTSKQTQSISAVPVALPMRLGASNDAILNQRSQFGLSAKMRRRHRVAQGRPHGHPQPDEVR